MTTATIVTRFTKVVKAKIPAAIDALNAEAYGWTIDADGGLNTNDEDGGTWSITFYRNGTEVIAVPECYIGEGAGATFTGSQGGNYELAEDGETLVVVA